MTGARIPCFWMEPTETGQLMLRRYRGDSVCAGPYGYHNAVFVIGSLPYPLDLRGYTGAELTVVATEDPRWPAVCDGCGEPFGDGDTRQQLVDRLFSGAPDGKLRTIQDMPPGAMFDATWSPVKGPDGVALGVVLPPGGVSGLWMPDQPSKTGGPWVRTGTLPSSSCTPSVQTANYHGYLTDGALVEA